MAFSYKTFESYIKNKLKSEWDHTTCPMVMPMMPIFGKVPELFVELHFQYIDSFQREMGVNGRRFIIGELLFIFDAQTGQGDSDLLDKVDAALNLFQDKTLEIETGKQAQFREGILGEIIPDVDREERVRRTLSFNFLYEQCGG